MKKYFPIACIAFISACGNAASDKKQDNQASMLQEQADSINSEFKQDSSLTYFERAIAAFKTKDNQQSYKELIAGADFLKKFELSVPKDSLQIKLAKAEISLRRIATDIKDNKATLENLQDRISKTELLLAHYYLDKADLTTPVKVYNALNNLAAYLQTAINHGNAGANQDYKLLLNETNALLQKAKDNPSQHSQELNKQAAYAKKQAALAQLFAY